MNGKTASTPSLATLERGYQLPAFSFALDAAHVHRYRSAVQAGSAAYEDNGEELAPPLAAVTFILREVLNLVQLPGGALHSGQEFDVHSPLPVGSVLACEATISQRSSRGGWLFLSIDVEATIASNGRRALSARTSVMIPQGA